MQAKTASGILFTEWSEIQARRFGENEQKPLETDTFGRGVMVNLC
jgi:hypothetical protein